MNTHEKRMRDLLCFTEKNSKDVPYGAAIYDENNSLLVSVVANSVTPVNHAEINAIQQCAKQFPGINWNSLTLYSTGEPCCMCAAACCWSNIKEVIYSTDIPFMIELWGIESSLRAIDIFNTHPKKPILHEHVWLLLVIFGSTFFYGILELSILERIGIEEKHFQEKNMIVRTYGLMSIAAAISLFLLQISGNSCSELCMTVVSCFLLSIITLFKQKLD